MFVSYFSNPHKLVVVVVAVEERFFPIASQSEVNFKARKSNISGDQKPPFHLKIMEASMQPRLHMSRL